MICRESGSSSESGIGNSIRTWPGLQGDELPAKHSLAVRIGQQRHHLRRRILRSHFRHDLGLLQRIVLGVGQPGFDIDHAAEQIRIAIDRQILPRREPRNIRPCDT